MAAGGGGRISNRVRDIESLRIGQSCQPDKQADGTRPGSPILWEKSIQEYAAKDKKRGGGK